MHSKSIFDVIKSYETRVKQLNNFFTKTLDILYCILLFVNNIYYLKGKNPKFKKEVCEIFINRGFDLFKYYIQMRDINFVEKTTYLWKGAL